MAAAALLRSVTSKMSRVAASPTHHHPSLVVRGLHWRGIHSRTSPDPIPSTPQKVLDTIDKTMKGVACIAVLGAAAYLHFWVNPALDEEIAKMKDLRNKNSHLIRSKNMDASSVSHQTTTAPALAGHGNATEKGIGVTDKLGKEEAVKTMHSQENHIKELQATIVDLKAEIAELKIALDSAPSEGKV